MAVQAAAVEPEVAAVPAAVAALVAPVKGRLVVAATVATDKPVAQVGPVVSALADRRSASSRFREVHCQAQQALHFYWASQAALERQRSVRLRERKDCQRTPSYWWRIDRQN
jgi:hypothetical protein